MNILKENSNAIKQWLDTIYPDILVAKYILLHEINKKNGQKYIDTHKIIHWTGIDYEQSFTLSLCFLSIEITFYLILLSNAYGYEFDEDSDSPQFGIKLKVKEETTDASKIRLYDRNPDFIPERILSFLTKDRYACQECECWMDMDRPYCCSCFPFVTNEFGVCHVCQTDREGLWVLEHDPLPSNVTLLTVHGTLLTEQPTVFIHRRCKGKYKGIVV